MRVANTSSATEKPASRAQVAVTWRAPSERHAGADRSIAMRAGETFTRSVVPRCAQPGAMAGRRRVRVLPLGPRVHVRCDADGAGAADARVGRVPAEGDCG